MTFGSPRAPCQPDTLPHAAGELVWIAAFEAVKFYEGRHFHRDTPALGIRPACAAQAERDIIRDCHPVVERRGLKHHAAIRPRPRDLLAIDDGGAFGWLEKARHHVEDRGLAAAGGP